MVNISIVMATYNGDKYITRQLESILSQIDANDELVIVDDSSKDETVRIIKTYQSRHPQIRLYVNNKNQGVISTFEKAISLASAEIIILSDQDDIFKPNRLNFCRDFFEKHINVNLLVQDCVEVDKDLKILNASLFGYLKSGPGLLKNLYKNTFLGATMSFRKKMATHFLPFPKCIPMHDIWIGLSISLFGGVVFDREPAISFVRHGNNFTPANVDIMKRLKWRLCLIINLIKLIILKMKFI